MKTYTSLPLWLFLLLFTLNCGGESYVTTEKPIAPASPSGEAPTEKPSPIVDPEVSKNIRIYLPNLVQGTLHVEQPQLSYHFVDAFSFASTHSNEQRYIDLTIPNQEYRYDVWVEDAQYKDPATQNTYTFSNNQQLLQSIVPAFYIQDQIAITPFTHLAKVAFDYYNPSLPWDHFENAYKEYLGIDTFLSLVPVHSGIYLDTNQAMTDSVRYGLWISALGRLAKVHQSVFETNTLDIRYLLAALEDDLAFNGILNGQPNISYGSGMVKLNHQTMRLHLAKGLHSYLLTSSVNQTPYTASYMMSHVDTLVDPITKNTNPLLFSQSSNVTVHSFSPEPADAEGSTEGLFAPPMMFIGSSPLTITGQASHTTGIYSLKGYLVIEEENATTTINLHNSNYASSFSKTITNMDSYTFGTFSIHAVAIDNCLNKKQSTYENGHGFTAFLILP